MSNNHPRYTTARPHFEQAKAYNQAVAAAALKMKARQAL